MWFKRWERCHYGKGLTFNGVVHHVRHHVNLVLVEVEARGRLPSRSLGQRRSDVAEGEPCWRQESVQNANLESAEWCQEASNSGSLKTEDSSEERSEDLGDDDGSANGHKEWQDSEELAHVHHVGKGVSDSCIVDGRRRGVILRNRCSILGSSGSTIGILRCAIGVLGCVLLGNILLLGCSILRSRRGIDGSLLRGAIGIGSGCIVGRCGRCSIAGSCGFGVSCGRRAHLGFVVVMVVAATVC